ncbi:MAG: MBL fold metallo-hydrolase [Clostridia bacterium]|nr:MBL fold metallo-hydrolase [Clostridia bacterium]
MAKFCSLFSSSSGNCTYIGTSAGGILIDIGVSAKKTEDALKDIGVDPGEIRAVFITHEHTDHINGVRVFAARHRVPVYATEGTLDGMSYAGVFEKADIKAYVMPEKGTEVDGIFVRPFRTPHDSLESCGFTVMTPDGKRLAVATDMGTVTETVTNALYGCDLVLLESNHDVRMLQNGSYPFYLKKRILSDTGHLNNEKASELAGVLLEGGTSRFILGHLSKENNIPGLAYETTKAAFSALGAEENKDYLLSVALDYNKPVIL